MKKIVFLWLRLVVSIGATAACTVTPSPTLPVKSLYNTPTPARISKPTMALLPPLKNPSGNASPSPSTSTANGELFTVPGFQTSSLGKGIQAQNYVQDTCQYLYERWNQPQNSAPGTVVVPVMFHSITDRKSILPGDVIITTEYFQSFMEHAHNLGFETITTAQLAGFLENNTFILPRSMILIVDYQKRAAYFTTFFEPYQKKYGWTVTNAWISHPQTPAYLWQENAALAASGSVDYQAHGVIHNIPMDSSVSLAYIKGEIYGPLTAMKEHFGKEPIAFIWPGGVFTPLAVSVARQAGYQLGFTSSPQGPLMFNWIPQNAEERAANDPLLTLPRYWDTDAYFDFDKAVKIAEEAQAFAEQNKALELGLYGQYCNGYPGLK